MPNTHLSPRNSARQRERPLPPLPPPDSSELPLPPLPPPERLAKVDSSPVPSDPPPEYSEVPTTISTPGSQAESLSNPWDSFQNINTYNTPHYHPASLPLTPLSPTSHLHQPDSHYSSPFHPHHQLPLPDFSRPRVYSSFGPTQPLNLRTYPNTNGQQQSYFTPPPVGSLAFPEPMMMRSISHGNTPALPPRPLNLQPGGLQAAGPSRELGTGPNPGLRHHKSHNDLGYANASAPQPVGGIGAGNGNGNGGGDLGGGGAEVGNWIASTQGANLHRDTSIMSVGSVHSTYYPDNGEMYDFGAQVSSLLFVYLLPLLFPPYVACVCTLFHFFLG